jgi:hypothetical protein
MHSARGHEDVRPLETPRYRVLWAKVPSSRTRKGVTLVALSLAALALLWEIGINLALSTHAIARLVSVHPEKLRIEYAKARSLWPGRVHLEDFDLRGRERGIEWELHLDGADADISLSSLLHHRFHVSKVTATGVTFRLRFRLETDGLDGDRVARMPPIDGFDPVPLRGVPPDPPASTAKPWSVDIEGVRARAVREVWIDAYRVVGQVAVEGGFAIDRGLFTLAPSVAVVDSVALTTGDDPIATDVTGNLASWFETVDMNAVKGAAVLRYLTMSSSLRGRMGSVRFVRHFLRGSSASLSGGAGSFESEVSVARGMVTGATSRIDLDPARVAFGDRTLEGRGGIRVSHEDAHSADGRPGNRVDATLSDFVFTDADGNGAGARCKTLETTWTAGDIDLSEPESVTRGLAYTWEAPRVELPDLHELDAALPKDSPFRMERGTATVASRGHGSLEGLDAQTSLESNVQMKIEGARVSAGVRATVPSKVDFTARTLDFSGADLTLSDPGLPEWWGKVRVETARVHVTPASMALALSTSARDGRPFLAFYAATAGASPVAKTMMSVIPGPLVQSMTANLHGSASLHAAPGAVSLDRLDVAGAASRLRGKLSKRGQRLDGAMLVEAGPAAFGISFESGKAGLVLVDATRWYSTEVAPPAR